MPYVEIKNGDKGNAIKWWGDIEETKRYVISTLDFLHANYGADKDCVILAGFSRGSIGCNYIGLHDDEIAPLWKAFFCYSHYDGLYQNGNYADADRLSALQRLQRLKGRPQFISQEASRSIDGIRDYLKETKVKGDFTFQQIPFRNHTDQWVLRDIPERQAARDWLQRVVKSQVRSEEHTSELQSLMRISYAVFCLKKKKNNNNKQKNNLRYPI